MRTSVLAVASFAVTTFALAGCASAPPPATPHLSLSEQVFEAAAPSVVAILNDDRADREAEIVEAERAMGKEAHAPKHVIDVSLRKEPLPQGTGFMIEGGNIVTAAHVVERPDRLKVTTRAGQTVAAELVRIDEVRDIAILHPTEPLVGVVPIPVETRDVRVGQTLWALGHTGGGYWALSWGMSQGIASGEMSAFGAKLLLFDAKIYPGFSGGPVVDLDDQGKARVVGVNHALFFVQGSQSVSALSSAVALSELREVIAGHPPAVQAALAAYAKKEREHVYADLFITNTLDVSRDANGQQVAEILGNARVLAAGEAGTYVPAVAMIFGLTKGPHDVDFEAQDPAGTVVAEWPATVTVDDKQRVSFVSGHMRFAPKAHGKYAVVLKTEGKEIGRSTVNIALEDDDDDLVEDDSGDSVDDGNPDVDIVVAQAGRADPLALLGIRGAWAETSYPRRVAYAWFARGTRGWSGTNVSITAFVLDDAGTIVGRADGCFLPELRPENSWSCTDLVTTQGLPLPVKEGHYDIVFAINDRPVAWWPMEAAIRKSRSGSDLERWMQEMRRMLMKKSAAAATTPPASAPAPTVKAAAPAKAAAKGPAPKK